MKLMNTTFALFIVSLFAFSCFISGSTAAIPESTADTGAGNNALSGVNPVDRRLPSAEGTNVNWHSETGSYNDTWTWQHNSWLYGPRSSYEIFYHNGSLMQREDFIPVDEEVIIRVNINKGVLMGASISSVYVSGSLMTQDMNFYAGFSLDYYNDTLDHWNSYSYSENYTSGYYSPPYLSVDAGACQVDEDDAMYYVIFSATFNSTTPVGLYSMHVNAYDTNFGSYDIRSRWAVSDMDYVDLAIGLPFRTAFSSTHSGGYTIEKFDLSGDPIYSVSRGTDFMMRLNISAFSSLDYVILDVYSYGVQIPVNMTGDHDITVVKYGGWVYDSDLDTYIYNSSAQYTVVERDYGDYVGTMDFHGYPYVDYEYRWARYNWTTDTYEVVRQLDSREMKLVHIYNFTSASFQTVYGFAYTEYPSDVYVESLAPQTMFYTESLDNAPVIFTELNESLSSVYNYDGTTVVEFGLHFTQQAPKGALMHIWEEVYDIHGEPYCVSASDMPEDHAPMTWDEYYDATEVAVETPATIAKLIRVDGTPVHSYFFPAKLGEPFIVSGRLQGGSDVADDIDGAYLELTAYDSFWSEDEWGYSNVIYEILVRSDSSVVLNAYNYSMKENYTYSTYWDYLDTVVTDWHWEYNEALGTDEWVYGDHIVTEYMETEGWHWEWYYFNQKTGEWVPERDWYNYDYRSELTRVSPGFALVTDVQQYTSGGDLYMSFQVNFTDEVPETYLYWQFDFANYTWVRDYNSYYGYHESGKWVEDWVYSFEYMSNDLWVGISSQIAVANNSIPGAADWMAVQEAPYITIGGVNYPIVVRELIDSSYDDQRILFYDSAGDYYELLNGTKIYIEEERNAWIYNITVAGYGSFLSAQDSPDHWDDGTDYYYSWWDIYGNVHQGTDWMIWDNPYVTVEFVNASPGIASSYYVRVGTSGMLDVQGWERNDPRTGTEYILDLDGNRYDIYRIDYSRYILYESSLQRISYVRQSYETSYMSAPAFIFEGWAMQYQQFTVDGHFEMPYPGALADRWEASQTTDHYGAVRTSKTIMIDSTRYEIGGDPLTENWYVGDYFNHTGFWVIVESQNYTLGGQRLLAASVNGSIIWQPLEVGALASYGSLDGLDFVVEGEVQVDDTYFIQSRYHPVYGYETNWTVTLQNGTAFSCEPRRVFQVYLLDVMGSLVYSKDYMWQSEMLGNDSYYYIEDLYGVRHYFDEGMYPPTVDVVVTVGWEERDALGLATLHYFVNGTEYVEAIEGLYGDLMIFTNGTLSGKYFHRTGWGDPANDAQWIYEIPFDGSFYNVTATREYIYKFGYVEGLDWVYELAPIESVTFRNFYEIIVGNPRDSMWGLRAWDVAPENNALDLDGDLETTDDQYYVLESYQSTDSWRSEWSRMWVDLMWDPNGTIFGDEMNIHSWMGFETYTWAYTWQMTFYWYNAQDMTPVSDAEFDTITDIVFDEHGDPNPGYWDVAFMAENVTWADILAEAEEEGWDWISGEEQTWSWLSFGVGQHYGIYSESNWTDVSLRYEFSGLMIWDDANNNSIMETYMLTPGDGELTHYFIPDSVGAIDFVTPGMSFGNFDANGTILAGVEDEIAWGVTFTDVNGTTFPFNAYAYWDWYGGVVTGSDFRTFDERPTRVSISELEFLVHFQGHLNTTEGASTNYAELKVDNTVGRWSVGMLGGMDNLEGRSLALNYFADVSVSSFSVRSDSEEVTGENTIVSPTFEMVSGSQRFAEMIIGGVTYEWNKDPYNVYNVTSQTTPLSTFRSAYESDTGQSATSWTFASTQYYVSIGFPSWDGYRVYQDPIFVGYVSNTGYSGGEEEVKFLSFSISPEVPSSTDAVQVGVDIDTDLIVTGVDLDYSTDGVVFHGTSIMSETSPSHYVGEIPPYVEGTQVWYRVVVHTDSGIFESAVQSYVVGSGVVTTSSTTGWTGPTGDGELPMELIMLVGGFGVVVMLVAVLAKRRK